jgi:hypothetical protein
MNEAQKRLKTYVTMMAQKDQYDFIEAATSLTEQSLDYFDSMSHTLDRECTEALCRIHHVRNEARKRSS